MKAIITYLVSKRNPNFTLDKEADIKTILVFLIGTTMDLLRGMKVMLYGKKPHFLMMKRGVTMKYAHKIKWGQFLKLGQNVAISALGKKGITLGNNVGIGDYSRLIVSTTLNDLGKGIEIGDHVGIGEFAYLGGAGGLTIESNCIIGQYFSCHPENHNFELDNLPIRNQGVTRQGIHIGQDCWIGSKVTILDGVSIGAHSIIAAGAVVNKSFPPYSVIGGVPAKKLKSRKALELKQEASWV